MSHFDNPTDLPNKLVRNLVDTAGSKHFGYELNGKQVRQLLDYLGVRWTPQLFKEKILDRALRAFKEAVRDKYGRKNVYFSMDKETRYDGREYDYLGITIETFDERADIDIDHMLKESGLSRHFQYGEYFYSGFTVSVTFESKDSREGRG